MYITGNIAGGSWFTFMKDWFEQCKGNENIYFLSYEDLKQNPRNMIIKIAKFLGKELTDEAVDVIVKRTNFEAMKENKNTNLATSTVVDAKISPFMRKGKVGDWKNHFTVAQNEQFNEIIKSEMGDYEDILKYID